MVRVKMSYNIPTSGDIRMLPCVYKLLRRFPILGPTRRRIKKPCTRLTISHTAMAVLRETKTAEAKTKADLRETVEEIKVAMPEGAKTKAGLRQAVEKVKADRSGASAEANDRD